MYIQANAVLHHDNLQFLEDIIPKTAPLRQIKDQAAATRAKLKGEKKNGVGEAYGNADEELQNGTGDSNKKSKASAVNGNGEALSNGFGGAADEDPNTQLEMEMKQAQAGTDGDVHMTG
jgi:hypothetical protein